MDIIEELKTLTSIRARLRCVSNHKLNRLGAGSSRIVYDLSNGYVVKVAKNKKGYFQNETEVELSNDWHINHILNVTTDNADNMGIVVARKLQTVTLSKLCTELGNVSVIEAEQMLCCRTSDLPESFWDDDSYSLLRTLLGIQQNYRFHYYGDMVRPSSWGVTDGGEMKLIDFGLKTKI
jgi:hypothetical protein